MIWPRPFRNLTFRLTLAYMALFCGSFALMLGASYAAGVWRPLQQVEAEVRVESDALVRTYEAGGRNALIRALEARAQNAAPRARYHVLLAPNGAVVATNLIDWPRQQQREWLRYEFGSYASGSEEEHEAVVRDLLLPGGYRLLVGIDTEDLDEREDMMLDALFWGAGMTLLLGLIGGLAISVAVSQRLESINRAARAVIGGDLSGRVKLRGSGDDFDQLSATLNEMLARIERLVASISRVSDSIAHELRTPLSRLMAELEDLAAAEDAAEIEARTAAALEEAARLQRLFEALLRLARVQSGGRVASEPVDLSRLLADAAELHGPAAEERGQAIALDVEPGLVLQGSRDLLFQMVSNLLDNAVKFSPAGGVIRLGAARRPRTLDVWVEDQGPGIAPAEHGRVFERFYRSPGAEAAPGFGLGLSLVLAIAEQHAATVALEDAVPGLRAKISFPLG
ncbi:HAMP domain-containing sensor histidine kinase [Phenylobacterium sp. LjRoot219]|uniref:HAMP domain-containing sensor histidine kinase n=1 Tax=Phenylobacterium sp. LjRoot219 TaxID=3342283 RepID=UPI003ED0CBC7